MMTRDSNVWWWLIAASIITAISSRLDLIDPLIPVAYHAQAHAIIELLALGATTIGGLMRMSPLNISPEGRAVAIEKNVVHAEKASQAAAVAAVKADEAAKATTEAVEATTIAAVESAKAADAPIK